MDRGGKEHGSRVFIPHMLWLLSVLVISEAWCVPVGRRYEGYRLALAIDVVLNNIHYNKKIRRGPRAAPTQRTHLKFEGCVA